MGQSRVSFETDLQLTCPLAGDYVEILRNSNCMMWCLHAWVNLGIIQRTVASPGRMKFPRELKNGIQPKQVGMADGPARNAIIVAGIHYHVAGYSHVRHDESLNSSSTIHEEFSCHLVLYWFAKGYAWNIPHQLDDLMVPDKLGKWLVKSRLMAEVCWSVAILMEERT